MIKRLYKDPEVMFSDAIIEPLQKTFAYKGCKITAQKSQFFFLRILPYQQDFFGIRATIRIDQEMLCLTYGIKCVGRIVTKSMSYFLHLCDYSVPYCASLEAWNWAGAGKQLHASHPRSSVWQIPNVTLFSGKYFLNNLKRSLLLNRQSF